MAQLRHFLNVTRSFGLQRSGILVYHVVFHYVVGTVVYYSLVDTVPNYCVIVRPRCQKDAVVLLKLFFSMYLRPLNKGCKTSRDLRSLPRA